MQEIKKGDIVEVLNSNHSHKELIGKTLIVDKIFDRKPFDWNPTKDKHSVGFWNGKNFLSIPSSCVKLKK